MALNGVLNRAIDGVNFGPKLKEDELPMLQCPKCAAEIGEEDFNVSTDLAYCRNCQSHLKYSEIRASIDGTAFENLACPKYVSINEFGERVEVIYRKTSPAVWFLIPFTILWSGGSVGMGLIIPLLNNKLDLHGALFFIPFLLGTIVLVSVILGLLFGKLRVVLDGENSEIYRGVGMIAWRNRFDFSNLKCVTIQKGTMSVNDVVQNEICLIMHEGDTIKFGAMMHEESRTYVAAAIAGKIRLGLGERRD
jgi:hypothetical protein